MYIYLKNTLLCKLSFVRVMGHILHLDLASVNVLKPRFDNKEDKV